MDLLWRRLGEAHDRLAKDLMAFVEARISPVALILGVNEFLGGYDLGDLETLFGLLENQEELFWPWFFYSWYYEPDMHPGMPDIDIDTPIAEMYADAHPDRLDSLQRRLIENTMDAPHSFWEVIDATPGHGMRMTDLLTGDTADIMERLASSSLNPGDILLCRVVRFDHVAMMMGCSQIAIPATHKKEILKFRASLGDDSHYLDEDFVWDAEEQVFACYRKIYRLLKGPPEITNTDEDPLSFLNADPEDVRHDPGLRQEVAYLLKDYWREWMDMPLSSLSGLTPRQAAERTGGRAILKDLLSAAEARQAYRAIANSLDDDPITMVRRRLGLEVAPEIASLGKEDRESTAGAAIRGLLVDFCGRFFTYEVTTLVFRLCDRLDVGTEFSLGRGRPEIWAASMVTTIAQMNDVSHPCDPVCITAPLINDFFGTKPSTVRNKARLIRESLGIGIGHPDYCTQDVVGAFTFIETPEGFIRPKKMAPEYWPSDLPAAAMKKPRIEPVQRDREFRHKEQPANQAVDDKQLSLFDD